MGRQVPPAKAINHESRRNTPWMPLTIVVSNASLQLLPPRDRRFVRVADDIDKRNPVKSDHLLEINVTRIVSVDIVYREAKVRAIGVRLEDVAPERCGRLRRRDMKEDRHRARLQDGIRLEKHMNIGRMSRNKKDIRADQGAG